MAIDIKNDILKVIAATTWNEYILSRITKHKNTKYSSKQTHFPLLNQERIQD